MITDLGRCPMPKSQGRHRFTGGWRPQTAGDLGGQTCFLCHQSWFRVPGGFLSSLPSTTLPGPTPTPKDQA